MAGSSPYQRLDLVVFSGTGNTRRVAEWLAGVARAAGVEARLHNVHAGMSLASTADPPAGRMLGLLTPTHGFTAPWLMLKVAARLPRGRGTYAFCAATRGSFSLGRLHVPGLAGTACWLLALLLWLRGYRVRGLFSLNMPSNWMSLHPPQSERSLRAIGARSRDKAERWGGRLLAGRRCWPVGNAIYESIVGLALAPISLGYLLVGRFLLGKMYLANSRCNGCGLCARTCPVGALRMWGRRRPRPFWTYRCESCMRCMAFCPQRAIDASQPWAALLVVGISLAGGHLAVLWLEQRWPPAAGLRSGPGAVAVRLAWDYALIFGAYYLFYGLSRLRPLNALFGLTSLYHFCRRYREPDARLRNLQPPRAPGDPPEEPPGSAD